MEFCVGLSFLIFSQIQVLGFGVRYGLPQVMESQTAIYATPLGSRRSNGIPRAKGASEKGRGYVPRGIDDAHYSWSTFLDEAWRWLDDDI